MTLKVIGAGVGRTGTHSLKTAINILGLGPCHHMEEVLANPPTHVPLWIEALNGNADWPAIYNGYKSAVDWPTAHFYRELHTAMPSAKFILTHRDPENWAQSFSQTIYKLLSQPDLLPPVMNAWVEMCTDLIGKAGFPSGLDVEGLKAAFIVHNDAVKAAIPAEQLLVFQVKEGWGPLCSFLDVPIPDEPFPHTNGRSEFWDLIGGKS